MYELDGSQFEKGKFELRLKKKLWAPLDWLLRMGPIRGRFVVLGILIFTAFATVRREPANLFVGKAWVANPEEAAMVQSVFSWGMCGLAVLIWLVFLLFREERLVLVWDKAKAELKTQRTPKIRQNPEIYGLYPFKDLQEIRVVGKDKEPRTPHGFLSVRVKGADGKIDKFEFKFLSDEQAKFFPLNIYRITQVSPVGDWVDPDSEVN